jgi:hypothetical protein
VDGVTRLRLWNGKSFDQFTGKFINRWRRSDEFKSVQYQQSLSCSFGITSSTFVGDNSGNEEAVFRNRCRPPLASHGLSACDDWVGKHSTDQMPNDRRFNVSGGSCHCFLKPNYVILPPEKSLL